MTTGCQILGPLLQAILPLLSGGIGGGARRAASGTPTVRGARPSSPSGKASRTGVRTKLGQPAKEVDADGSVTIKQGGTQELVRDGEVVASRDVGRRDTLVEAGTVDRPADQYQGDTIIKTRKVGDTTTVETLPVQDGQDTGMFDGGGMPAEDTSGA